MSDVLAALREGYTDPIRDPLWGHVYLTPALAALTESAPFMRMYRILQLGPAYCAYPGATHTRAAHSVGVYCLARRLLTHLAEQGADSWLTAAGARSFLCAALLHDLGHFPYAHSLKELPLRPHEALTGGLILSEPLKSLAAAAGADPERCAAIVDTASPSADAETLFYRRLLSGALDPDKLDYLNRDARYCGVPYGAQDVDFILSRVAPHAERGVDIDSRGIPSVESILFSRYLMYRTVYWHHSVRAATAMIKKALLAGLEGGHIAAEELYSLDDQSLFSLLAAKRYPLAELGSRVRDGALFTLAAEIPFDEAKHRPLLDIAGRSRREAALAEAAGLPRGLIIDIPEPVSFETGLYVRDEDKPFAESSSSFRPALVQSFIRSLRVVRIFVDDTAEHAEKCRPALIKAFQNEQNWLQ